MATRSEHYQRARAAMLGASANPDEVEVERMLAAARPHLVGWLADELAEQTGQVRLSLSGFTDGSLSAAPGEHLWALTTFWRLGPLDLLAGAATVDVSRLMHSCVPTCAHCLLKVGEAAGRPCEPTSVG